MTPKTIKYVDQVQQDNFSCKLENTLKSMEFSEAEEQLCLLTVHLFLKRIPPIEYYTLSYRKKYNEGWVMKKCSSDKPLSIKSMSYLC